MKKKRLKGWIKSHKVNGITKFVKQIYKQIIIATQFKTDKKSLQGS